MFASRIVNRNNKRKRGYSLLEIMVVVGITAVLLGMAATRYRGMQDKNHFNGEVERFQDELKLMPTLSQAAGNMLNKSGNQPTSTTSVPNNNVSAVNGYDKFHWIAYQNEEKKAEGIIGERQAVALAVNSKYASAVNGIKMSTGAWVDIIGLHQNGGSSGIVARIIFRPDGTPLDAGAIRIQAKRGSAIERQIQIVLKKLGGVEVNNTTGN